MHSEKHALRHYRNQSFVQSMILLGFIILLIWLDISKQLPLYINPKFILLTQFSYLLLIPMFAAQLIDTLLPVLSLHQHHGHTFSSLRKYLPFFFLLFIAFSVPENTLTATLVNSKGLNSPPAVMVNYPIEELPRPLAPAFQQMETIKITNLNYTEAMFELNNFPKDYLGKKVTMDGFVFRSPGLTSNQLSLVRYVIMCCTADSLPYGMMCEGIKANSYPEGTWLSVEGTIQMSSYDDKDVPVIKITASEKIEAPKDPYVYPYN